jgi:hypothetical protein
MIDRTGARWTNAGDRRWAEVVRMACLQPWHAVNRVVTMASRSWRWFAKHRASIGMRVVFYAQFLVMCYQCLLGLLEFHHYHDAERALRVVTHLLDPLLEYGSPFGYSLTILGAAMLLRPPPKQALQYIGLSAILIFVDWLGGAARIRV